MDLPRPGDLITLEIDGHDPSSSACEVLEVEGTNLIYADVFQVNGGYLCWSSTTNKYVQLLDNTKFKRTGPSSWTASPPFAGGLFYVRRRSAP